MTAAQSLDSSYNPTAPGVGANGKVQVVLLDFDTAYQAAGGVFDFNSYYGRAGITPLHIYSTAERQAILQVIENDYGPFLFVPGQSNGGICFTLSAGDSQAKAQTYTGSATQYITEYFDQSVGAGGDEPSPEGTPPGVPATPQFEPGGTSSDLDFRDADMTGTASIQVNGILGEPLMPPATEQNWIAMSAKIGAHELGHLLGLHHEDSFGPIGQGIMPLPNGGNYNPPYPGPYDASETFDNIMTSGDSVALTAGMTCAHWISTSAKTSFCAGVRGANNADRRHAAGAATRRQHGGVESAGGGLAAAERSEHRRLWRQRRSDI